jgi:hypothetical protein
MISPSGDRLIDRLVDDELDPAERRALLGRLDAEPGGWRRCALAFLEAQSWRAALAALADEPAAGEPGRRPGRMTPRPALVGLAAGLLAAFALGWAAGGSAHGPPRQAPDRVTSTPAGQASPGAQPVPTPAPAEPVRIGSTATRVRPVSSGRTVLAIPGLDERWLRRPPAPLPEPLRRQWERRGYRVEQQHALMTVPLKDGRRMAVPVDEVRLRYVGKRAL